MSIMPQNHCLKKNHWRTNLKNMLECHEKECKGEDTQGSTQDLHRRLTFLWRAKNK